MKEHNPKSSLFTPYWSNFAPYKPNLAPYWGDPGPPLAPFLVAPMVLFTDFQLKHSI